MTWKTMSADERVAAIRTAIVADPRQSDGAIAERLGVKRDVVSWYIRKHNVERLVAPGEKRRKKPAPRPALVPSPHRHHGLKFGAPVSDVPLLPADVDATAFQPLPGSTPKTLTDLAVLRYDGTSTECHWPVGDGPILFCGCATDGASRYCAVHTKRSGKMVPRLVLA